MKTLTITLIFLGLGACVSKPVIMKNCQAVEGGQELWSCDKL